MNVRLFQRGFNYAQDGPGNRLVYHLQGCNMRCPWCANPEGMDVCGGAEWAVEAVLDEALRSRSMFFEGGGVTFTGGEPTVQFEALSWLLTALKQGGIDTALETNASHPRLPELFGRVDHLMMDFKQPFDDRHRAVTGMGGAAVLENLRRAGAEHPNVVVRVPVVNGYNASPEDMEAFACALGAVAGENVRVEPLRYHEYGRDKWARLGMAYEVRDGFVTDEQMRDFSRVLHEHGLNTVHS